MKIYPYFICVRCDAKWPWQVPQDGIPFVDRCPRCGRKSARFYMTFSQEDRGLLLAVDDVARSIELPGRDRVGQEKESVLRMIQARLPIGHSAGPEEMWAMWMLYRKSGEKRKYGMKRMAFMAAIMRLGHIECCWKHRGRGACAGTVTIEHLRPRARGGSHALANCDLACAYHNSSRGRTPVEDYIRSEAVDQNPLPLFDRG